MPGTTDGLALSHYDHKRWPPTIIVVKRLSSLANVLAASRRNSPVRTSHTGVGR